MNKWKDMPWESMADKPCEFHTPEKVAERLYGKDWRTHPDYLKGREWVRENFYGGGEMPSDKPKTQRRNGSYLRRGKNVEDKS